MNKEEMSIRTFLKYSGAPFDEETVERVVSYAKKYDTNELSNKDFKKMLERDRVVQFDGKKALLRNLQPAITAVGLAATVLFPVTTETEDKPYSTFHKLQDVKEFYSTDRVSVGKEATMTRDKPWQSWSFLNFKYDSFPEAKKILEGDTVRLYQVRGLPPLQTGIKALGLDLPDWAKVPRISKLTINEYEGDRNGK